MLIAILTDILKRTKDRETNRLLEHDLPTRYVEGRVPDLLEKL